MEGDLPRTLQGGQTTAWGLFLYSPVAYKRLLVYLFVKELLRKETKKSIQQMISGPESLKCFLPGSMWTKFAGPSCVGII